MIDTVEILVHWYAGRSQHELAASLGVDRKTQRKYVAPAVAAGFEPGGPLMAEGDWRTLVVEWFPALADSGLRQVSWPSIEAQPRPRRHPRPRTVHHLRGAEQQGKGQGCRRRLKTDQVLTTGS